MCVYLCVTHHLKDMHTSVQCSAWKQCHSFALCYSQFCTVTYPDLSVSGHMLTHRMSVFSSCLAKLKRFTAIRFTQCDQTGCPGTKSHSLRTSVCVESWFIQSPAVWGQILPLCSRWPYTFCFSQPPLDRCYSCPSTFIFEVWEPTCKVCRHCLSAANRNKKCSTFNTRTKTSSWSCPVLTDRQPAENVAVTAEECENVTWPDPAQNDPLLCLDQLSFWDDVRPPEATIKSKNSI